MKNLAARYYRSARRRRSEGLHFERVEPRMMLAGDVSVFVTNGQLFVLGDGLSNQIQVIGSANGNARVLGLDGTTINGGITEFNASQSLMSVGVQLNGGDDSVSLQGLVLPMRLELQGNAGNDAFEVMNSSVGSFSVLGGGGNDMLQLDNLFVAELTLIDMGDGADIVSVNSLSASRNIGIFTGNGNDVVSINDMSMGRLLALSTGAGDDVVLLAGETSAGSGSGILLGSGDDFLGVLPGQTGAQSMWQNRISIDTGSGDDQVAMDSRVTTGKSANLNGRSGNDSFRSGGAAYGSTIVAGFEAAQVGNVDAILDALFSRLSDADIDPSIFGGPELVRALDVSTGTTTGNLTENGDPLVLDENLELSGPRDAEVTSATVSINPVFAGDMLLFENTADIGGTYNSGSGVLNLFGTGDLAEWEAALQSVRFTNVSDNPDTSVRTILFTVNAVGESDSAALTVNILSVPDAPILTVSDETRIFDIDDAAQQRPQVLDDGLTLKDPDTTEFNTGLVSISIASGLRPGDVLGFTPVAGVTANFNAGTGVLALGGTVSTASLEAFLRTLTFDNENARPELGTRIVNISVFDGSLTATRNIEVDVIASESIMISVNAILLSFTEFDEPTAVDPDLTVTPGVNAPGDSVDSATVQFATGFVAGQDILEFTPVTGITGNFDSATGILSFSGTANVSVYQDLLRSVRYANAATGEDLVVGDRRIEFTVVENGTQSFDSRNLRVSAASEQRLIQNYLDANGLTSVVTSSGLHFISEQAGNGNSPTTTDSVVANYTGFLLSDNTIFDSGTGATFPLSNVIPGWQEGIPLFSVGGSGQLIIPSDLAYGTNGIPGVIPANAILRFAIDLLDFFPTPPPTL